MSIRQAAQARLDEARSSAERWHRKLSEAQAAFEEARAQAERWQVVLSGMDEIEGPSSSAPHPTRTPFTVRLRVPTTENPGRLAETQTAAISILRAARRPMSTRELLSHLEQRGVSVGGSDPSSTLSARLSRAPLLDNVRGVGWRVKESSEEGRTGGRSFGHEPPALDPTSHSANEDGREVAHDNNLG